MNSRLTRREAVLSLASFLSAPAVAAVPAWAWPAPAKRTGKLLLRARSRKQDPPAGGAWRVVQRQLQWQAAETAIIICDMWDDHWCKSAARRVAEMAPQINSVIAAARRLGVTIIHAPSDTIDFYAGTPQRRRMQQAPAVEPPVPIESWCHLEPAKEHALPIDDSDGGCDDAEPGKERRVWTRQHTAIEIAPSDGISDSGHEVYNFCEQTGIRNLAMMGVHTNMCVLGRSFGIRQMTRLGKSVVLARDLTDAMYDPRDEPRVSHKRGTQLVVEHIERYWCPSIVSRDLAHLMAGTGST